MASVELISKVRSTVQSWLANLSGDSSPKIPKEGSAEVANAMSMLWRESLAWRQNSLEKRASEFAKGYSDPVKFWEDCRRLEQGTHWEVYGRRNTQPGSEWQHELVDDEVGNQVRVRKAYLTGQWHDVTIYPNIEYLSQILDQERQNTRWGDTVTQFVHRGLVEGTAIVMSTLDRSENEDGIVREIVCDNASLFPTPNCTSFEQIDGCWFMIYATLEQKRFILEEYPHLEKVLLEVDKIRAQEISLDPSTQHWYNFQYNGLVDKLVCYLDDDTLEEIDFSTEDTDAEHAQMHQGADVPVEKDQNHKKHVEAHTAWLDEINSVPPEERSPEDSEFVDTLTQLVLMHIQDHLRVSQKKTEIDGIPVGKRKKYPYGRRIVIISNNVAEDTPSPYQFDWRKLFHKWEPEKLPESFWGRGTPEVLWNTNKTLDTMASRIADIALSVGIPKRYYHITDKATVDEQKLNNDPLEPEYYQTQMPQFRQGQSPPEFLQIYQMMKANVAKQQGVSNVTYGQSPTSQASGDLAEILLRQNQIIVTGEANQRLADTIEGIIETRLMMWKQFYTEPRFYYLNGKFKPVNLSKVLNSIPMFQVSVKPGSNIANQWEIDFAFALQLFNTKTPDGMPLIPKEALLDMLASRYPQYGRDGDYYQLNEATRLGLQVMSQEQAKRKEEVRTLKGVREKFKKQGLQDVLENAGQIPPNGGQPQKGAIQ